MASRRWICVIRPNYRRGRRAGRRLRLGPERVRTVAGAVVFGPPRSLDVEAGL
ncbi:MAG: hypothetical protein ACP5JG_04965 [Anaerolineae bacterium]